MRVGLLADTSLQLTKLRNLLSASKFDIAVAALSGIEGATDNVDVDVWLTCIDVNNARSMSVYEKLEATDVPIIFDDELDSQNIESYLQRVSDKLDKSLNKARAKTESNTAAKVVWVLAASTGGPEAVIAFFKSLHDSLDKVAFVYAQHIDDAMLQNLKEVVQRSTDWNVSACSHGGVPLAKHIYLVPPAQQLEFDETGCMFVRNAPWAGDYAPSINQVMARVAKAFGKHSGAIVLTGMGDDGAATAKLVALSGGQVWVQSPESCTIDSMPNKVIETEVVSFVGTPQQLAEQFCREYTRQYG